VNPAATTTTITQDTPDPSTAGVAVPVHYTVVANPPGAGTPTGNVTVTDGVSNCTGTVAAGQCNLTLTTLGARTLTASYATDGNFASSGPSAGEAHQVNGIATSTVVSSSANPSVFGQSITFTATVAGTGTPTGSVQFVVDGSNLGTAVTLSGGTATSIPTASLAEGIHTVAANYTATGNFVSSSGSLGGGQDVNPAATTTSITNRNPASTVTGQGTLVTYSVAVNAPGAGTPTGTVTVSDGAGHSCSGSAPSGNCSVSFPTIGTKNLTANYVSATTSFGGSTSGISAHTVSKANTSVTVSGPAATVVGESYDVTFSVVAVPPGGGIPTGSVDVNDGNGGTCNGTIALGHCGITSSVAGTLILTATYAGDGNYNGDAGTGSHVVTPAATTTTILSDNPDPSNSGDPVTVSVIVASAGGIPTGTVDVTTDGTETCTATLSSGTGSCVLSLTGPGPRTISASYVSDGNFKASTSANESHAIN
jgi:hypothetical protein